MSYIISQLSNVKKSAHHPRWMVGQEPLAHPGHVQVGEESLLVVGAKPLVREGWRVRELYLPKD